jgi:aryl-alcohol dehydrogenase-like predicted oxidoreductase
VVTRALGRTGLNVSVLGYGAWGISQHMWVGADDDRSLASLGAAIEAGVNFIDTALAYGDGHSERLVGRAVRESERAVYVATKIPPKNGQWPAQPGVDPDDAFPADWIRTCTERSLDHLGLEAIDLQQFHVWSDEWVGRGSWIDAIEQLKADGTIRSFGISINEHDSDNALRLLETGLVDAVQVLYNIFDQSAADRLFAAASEANVGVIVRVPFDEGALTGHIRPDTEFSEGDWRNRYFAGNRKQEVWDHVTAITDDLSIEIGELPAVALRFCLSHPAVSTVIPGMSRVENVQANVAAANAGELDDTTVAKLRGHRWERNYYE